jgi:hypothetical protein
MTITNVGPAAAAPVYSGGVHESAAHDSGVNPTPAPAPAPAPASAPAVPGGAPVDDAELEKIMGEPIRQANITLRPYDRQIEREVHDVTKALMYKIRDTKTNEVIAEYPPKKIQDMIAKMWELAGLFIDQKA